MADRYLVKMCAGSHGWCEVLKKVTLPGEWYMESVGKYDARGPFQGAPTYVYLFAGFAKIL
jgi:hypothetical protein